MDKRHEQYLICTQRGHESSELTLTSDPPWEVCRHCGTHFRYEQMIVEANVPSEDE